MEIALVWYEAQPRRLQLDLCVTTVRAGEQVASSVEDHYAYLELHRELRLVRCWFAHIPGSWRSCGR
jgi:hypothetical protein